MKDALLPYSEEENACLPGPARRALPFSEKGSNAALSPSMALKHGDSVISSGSQRSLGSLESVGSLKHHRAGSDSEIDLETGKKKRRENRMVHRFRLSLRNHPMVSQIRRSLSQRYQKIPSRYKYLCFVLWVSWKFVAAFLLVHFVQSSSSSSHSNNPQNDNSILRLLYIVTITSLDQPNTAWKQSVLDLVSCGRYNVQVVLIQGDDKTSQREADWRQGLPEAVKFSLWSDAIPYMRATGGQTVVENRDALLYQHRYVLKDNCWFDHDIFMVWDGASQLRPVHVDYFWKESQRLRSNEEIYSSKINLVIPGFASIRPSLAKNQTQIATNKGPFDGRSCCGIEDSNLFAVEESSVSVQGGQEVASPVGLTGGAILPATPQGWMMTRWQLGHVIAQCPHFLPTVDRGPDNDGCMWTRWINLDEDVYSLHFVSISAGGPRTDKSVSPNHLWNQWREQA